MDEISRIIGQMEASMQSLARSLDRDRETDDQRHLENTERLGQIAARCEQIERTIEPLKTTVQTMQPIVDSLMIARWKIAGALMLGSVLVGLTGWVFMLFAAKIWAWLLALLRLG